jgi:hypothetical protein
MAGMLARRRLRWQAAVPAVIRFCCHTTVPARTPASLCVCRYQQLFESELSAAEELTSIGERALAVGAWPFWVPAQLRLAPAPKPAISVLPPLSADGVAAAQPGHDYVLRYDSQHTYETLTGKLRMLREWRVGRGSLLTGVVGQQAGPPSGVWVKDLLNALLHARCNLCSLFSRHRMSTWLPALSTRLPACLPSCRMACRAVPTAVWWR